MTDTPLKAKLRRLIEANGPMSIADYMAHCLGDPDHGYYTTRDPFGAAGDFITAPEVSQMFGEIVGAWLVHMWRAIGRPDPVRLVELGPGRGTLMADILRVAANAPDFRKAASVHLVETSPALRKRQAETLTGQDIEIAWHDRFSLVPDGALLLVANEFFDALPIRQYVRRDGAWRERVVGLDADDSLVFGAGGEIRLSHVERSASDGAILEIRPSDEALVADIAARIVNQNGAALIIDYGHADTAFGDTLQAVRGHAYADPLAAPGEADLTAHVDFAALGRAAAEGGVAAHGPMTQREFLLPLGLAARADRLAEGAGAPTRQSLQAAVSRLTGKDAMGTLFKVMALSRPGLVPPPFPTGV